eukprot:g81610.t1
MANLKYDPGKDVLRRLCTEEKAESFTAQGIANTLNAVAKLDYNPGEAVLRTLCAEALKKAESFDLQSIANTLNALKKLDYNPASSTRSKCCEANLDYNPEKKLLKTLYAEVLKKAEAFTAQGIANTLNAVAKLDYNPGEAVVRTLCAEALKKAESFVPQDIGNTLNALSKLDYNPGEQVLRRLCAEAFKKAESFNAQEIANTLYACIVLNLVDPSLFSRLISLLPLPEKVDPKGLSQLHYVQISLRSEHAFFGPYLPAPLADACWSSMMQEAVHSSELHKEVSKVLRDEGVPHVNEDTSSGLLVEIGMAEHRVVIEVDGPSHFVAGSVESRRPKYSFATLCKHRLLKAMGWGVVSVPFYEWEHLRPAEQVLYLRRKLREVGVENV